MPAVNQIEVHPYLTNEAVRGYAHEHGIATEAWSPIAQGGVLDDPTITAIAERLGKTPAQVTLRWHVQRGDIIFPKSTTPARIKENFEIFDFELDDTDIATISALDKGEEGPHRWPSGQLRVRAELSPGSRTAAGNRPGLPRL